jgi:hypothetical protein
LGARAFYHISTRAQPDSPTRQRCCQIGNDRSIRPDYETDHPLLGQPLAGNDAPAERADFRFIVGDFGAVAHGWFA